MEENDTTQDASDVEDPTEDATVAIWGQRRTRRTAGEGDAPAVDIWGPAPVEAGAADQPDPIAPPPELWGDGGEPRAGGEPDQGDTGPSRFLLPTTWVAAPKRKPGWLRRFRRS